MFKGLMLCLFAIILTTSAQTINLSGKILNRAGYPIANAVVSLVNEGSKDTTTNNGSYSITKSSVAVSSVALFPESQEVTVKNGQLRLSLPNAMPVKIEVFDVKGKLLAKEVSSKVPGGFYSFNIDRNLRTSLLIIRATIGNEKFLIRHIPLKNSYYSLNRSDSKPLSLGTSLAKIVAINDTLRVTAANYITGSVAITSYELKNLNITLDSATAEAGSSSGCGKNPTLKSGRQSVQVNGQTRNFLIRIPENYNNTHPYPLVFAFHWNGGNMNEVDGGGTSGYTWSYYGLREQADKSTNKQMIFVAPDGLSAGWANSNGRDIAFVDEMLKLIKGNLCIDTTRIFALGFSYGGGMSYAIACSRAKVFRAVAVYSGMQLSGCDGGNDPIAYLGIHGIGDPTCGIAAGRSLRDRFVRNNGCTAQNAPEPSGGSKTHICTRFDGCRDGYPVEWCAFDGGHTPGNVDGGGDDGAKTWTKEKTWQFFTQF